MISDKDPVERLNSMYYVTGHTTIKDLPRLLGLLLRVPCWHLLQTSVMGPGTPP